MQTCQILVQALICCRVFEFEGFWKWFGLKLNVLSMSAIFNKMWLDCNPVLLPVLSYRQCSETPLYWSVARSPFRSRGSRTQRNVALLTALSLSLFLFLSLFSLFLLFSLISSNSLPTVKLRSTACGTSLAPVPRPLAPSTKELRVLRLGSREV